jgi:hypothetical protein
VSAVNHVHEQGDSVYVVYISMLMRTKMTESPIYNGQHSIIYWIPGRKKERPAIRLNVAENIELCSQNVAAQQAPPWSYTASQAERRLGVRATLNSWELRNSYIVGNCSYTVGNCSYMISNWSERQSIGTVMKDGFMRTLACVGRILVPKVNKWISIWLRNRITI